MAEKSKDEKRRSTRVSILQETHFDGRKTHPATNISEGGMFIAFSEGYYLEGSVLDLKFRLEDGDEPLSARAEVVHASEGTGMGMRFLDPDPEVLEKIRKFVARRSK
jgi:c-di-GMP-binding flagellar brake protein YcgR